MVHLKSWLVSPAPCQGPIWRWENTWWSTRLLTRPRTRRSASSPSLSSSSSKSTPEESMFSNTIARTFVWFIDYLSTRWVLCRVGNTGRQIRLLVPKVIFSSNFNFFSNSSQNCSVPGSSRLPTYPPQPWLIEKFGLNICWECPWGSRWPKIFVCKEIQWCRLEPKNPGFDFQYNALGFILQKLQFSTFTLHLSSGKDIVINIEFGKKNIHLW